MNTSEQHTDYPPTTDQFSQQLNPNPSQFPESGFVRVKQIITVPGKAFGFIPVSESTWWVWVKDGKAPSPIKLGPKITVWRAEDVRAFAIAQGLVGKEANDE